MFFFSLSFWGDGTKCCFIVSTVVNYKIFLEKKDLSHKKSVWNSLDLENSNHIFQDWSTQKCITDWSPKSIDLSRKSSHKTQQINQSLDFAGWFDAASAVGCVRRARCQWKPWVLWRCSVPHVHCYGAATGCNRMGVDAHCWTSRCLFSGACSWTLSICEKGGFKHSIFHVFGMMQNIDYIQVHSINTISHYQSLSFGCSDLATVRKMVRPLSTKDLGWISSSWGRNERITTPGYWWSLSCSWFLSVKKLLRWSVFSPFLSRFDSWSMPYKNASQPPEKKKKWNRMNCNSGKAGHGASLSFWPSFESIYQPLL